MSLMLTSHKSPWGAGLVVLPHLRDLEALETRRELLVGAKPDAVNPTLCYLNAQALGEKLLGRLGGISLDSGSSVT